MHGSAAAVVLLLLVTLLSAFSERLRLPPPVVLAVAGLGLGLLPGVPPVHVDPELIQAVLLPLLLYAAARDLPEREVRAEARTITALALGLVLATALVVAVVASRIVPQLSFPLALTLGAMLGATDPVAVTALARRLPLPRRLLVVAASESLFNDATGLVLYRVALAAAVGGTGISLWRASGEFLLLAAGGAVAGLLVGWVSIRLRHHLHDPLLENALSLLSPLAAYLVAEEVHTSGIMAVVVAGLWSAARAPLVSSTEARVRLGAVWDMIVFVLEGVIFLLIGLVLPGALRALPAGDVRGVLWRAVGITAAVILVRIAWVFVTSSLPRLLPRSRPGDRGGRPALSWRVQAALAWTGTRGAVALAAALALPQAYSDGRPFAERDLLIVLTVSVVLLTLLLQGLTLGLLLRRFRVAADDPVEEELEGTQASAAAARAALLRLEQIRHEEEVPDVVVGRLKDALEADLERIEDVSAPAVPLEEQYQRLRRRLLHAEREELQRLHDAGVIRDSVWRAALLRRDLEETRLGVGSP